MMIDVETVYGDAVKINPDLVCYAMEGEVDVGYRGKGEKICAKDRMVAGQIYVENRRCIIVVFSGQTSLNVDIKYKELLEKHL